MSIWSAQGILWTVSPWLDFLVGALMALTLILQERVYPLPTPDDPTNRGGLRLFHNAIALSRFLFAIVTGCVIALGLLRLAGGA